MLETHRILAGKNVLVVENEWLIALDLTRALTSEGAHVVGPVASAAQAFALLGRKSRIDAAVLDIHLGNQMDVYPLAEALRWLDIPFIFATGYDHRGIRRDFANIPHMLKPFTPNIVGPALATCLIHQLA